MRNKKVFEGVMTRFSAWRPVFIGIVVALLFLLLSLLPSLLPRPWWLQGFISGLSMAIGYGIGLAISRLIRWFIQREIVSQQAKIKAWRVLSVLAPTSTVVFLVLGVYWQNDVRELLGVESIGTSRLILVFLATALFFSLFIFIGQLYIRIKNRIQKYFSQRVPIRVSVAVGLFLSLAFVYFLVSGVLFSTFLRVADSAFSTRDNTAPEGIIQPQSFYKSGSPESLIPWEAIGFQGRGFVGGGPSQDDLTNFNGQLAEDPIRVYAGLSSANTAEERANLAVAELRRTNAFERDVLVIITATGTGWIDPTVADALEYMYNGNSAMVSQQYSYLPSWISFLVDQERAREAGRVLYDAVLEEWIAQPDQNRPRLIVYGLSLGSFGGQEAFSGVNDMRRSVDGVLFTGTPNDSKLWRTIIKNRDEGSPEWQPVVNRGQSVRFASNREDIINNQEVWQDDTRILFMQHANDPVVWFSFDLIFNKPDWLREERGRAVSSTTRWYPIVTFLHIGLDQAIAASAPIGQGHYYMDTAVQAWAAVVAPYDDWSLEDSDALQRHLDEREL